MAFNLPEIWKKNRLELDNALEVGEFTASTTEAVLGLAIALGVTANPFVGVTAAGLALVPSVNKVIEFIANKQNKKSSLEEIVALAAPSAYLESFNNLIERNIILVDRINQGQNQKIEVDSRIKNFSLTPELAINALRSFHSSELAQTFNQILSSQLSNKGLSQREITIVVAWVAWETGYYLKKEIKKRVKEASSPHLAHISIYLNANQENNSIPYKSIKIYLKKQIANKPKDKVFNEKFRFKDIYVPLETIPVDANGRKKKGAKCLVLEEWAKEMLLNPQKQKQVMFIQGGPGRGKSVFCRMFADWVREKIHPLWIPILIRLRDIESFEQSFEKTLQQAVKANFARDDSWLTNSKFRFLFFLDGFDELRMEGRVGGGIERFIKQVGSFQERCNTSEMGHRFIVTGRQLALQGISYLPENLERVELQAMNPNLQEQWLANWKKVVNEDATIAQEKTATFKAFLDSKDLAEDVKKDLAKEPLLLYLLAAMHRDGDIKVEDLEGTSGIQAKIRIYEQALNSVLTEQRQDAQREIVTLETDQLCQVLMEAGLSVIQSGGECAKFETIEQGLFKSKSKIAEKIKQIRTDKGDLVLKNALAAFYIKPASKNEEGAVEFFHKSFGEFLCAKRMKQSLERWTKWENDENEFSLNKRQLAEEIYDLLGYGGLTREIVEYLFGLLTVSDKFAPVELFDRLEEFYRRWSDGKFIDEPPDSNYPQQKMRRLKEQKPETTNKQAILGLRQVDVYTGLNVMILLLELYPYVQKKEELQRNIAFNPCGQSNEQEESKNSTLLLRLIVYSSCIGDNGFLKTMGYFLRNANQGVNLTGANLIDAILEGANLGDAILEDAILKGAILEGANLKGANLTGANLIDANLKGANLTGANLERANLIDANLEDTKLEGANLGRAHLVGALLKGAKINKETKLDDKWRLVWEIVNQKAEGRDLSNANLTGANLIDANLTGANLTGAILTGADLIDANLTGAILTDANLTGANLRSANLERAVVNNARFSFNSGIDEPMKKSLIQRGAIFIIDDNPGDHSTSRIPIPD